LEYGLGSVDVDRQQVGPAAFATDPAEVDHRIDAVDGFGEQVAVGHGTGDELFARGRDDRGRVEQPQRAAGCGETGAQHSADETGGLSAFN
jgi:hypothetical protein